MIYLLLAWLLACSVWNLFLLFLALALLDYSQLSFVRGCSQLDPTSRGDRVQEQSRLRFSQDVEYFRCVESKFWILSPCFFCRILDVRRFPAESGRDSCLGLFNLGDPFVLLWIQLYYRLYVWPKLVKQIDPPSFDRSPAITPAPLCSAGVLVIPPL